MARRGADTDYDTYFTLIVQPHPAQGTKVFAGTIAPQATWERQRLPTADRNPPHVSSHRLSQAK